MKKNHFANILAFGLGITSLATNLEASSDEPVIFGIQSQEITLTDCSSSALSISNIHQMIGERNWRDAKLVRSSTDKMNHL